MTSCRNVRKQIALVGDGYCGKTALAVRLSTDLFLDSYAPTYLVDDFTAEFEAGKYTCKLTLLDLSGGCEDQSIRSLVYQNCDAVVVCFDLTDSESLERVEKKWLPELEENCPDAPLILAGCKQDEMCDGPASCVCETAVCCSQLTRDKVKGLLVRTRARAYIECSSKYADGVDELAHLVMEVSRKKQTAARKFASSIKNSKLLKKFARQ